MSTQTSEIDELRAQVAELSEKLNSLSSLVANLMASPGLPFSIADAQESTEDLITEDLLIAISAAVAAYLGKRAPIRHVRLIGSTSSWGMQGRVKVQASHPLTVKRSN